MRTTIDIDDPILKDLKRLQRREGKSLGRLVSDLLAQAL
ncbi:MAG: antitoxin, partial [Burkholderiaceae bacterium]